MSWMFPFCVCPFRRDFRNGFVREVGIGRRGTAAGCNSNRSRARFVRFLEGSLLKSHQTSVMSFFVTNACAPRREGELSEKIASVNLINVHELGTIKSKDPNEVAKHAYFMAANMLVAVGKHVRRINLVVHYLVLLGLMSFERPLLVPFLA